MDLSTTYLGLELPHPLMPGASPLVDDLGMVRRLEDAGAAAIVMHSLFEEQIRSEQRDAMLFESFGELLRRGALLRAGSRGALPSGPTSTSSRSSGSDRPSPFR